MNSSNVVVLLRELVVISKTFFECAAFVICQLNDV